MPLPDFSNENRFSVDESSQDFFFPIRSQSEFYSHVSSHQLAIFIQDPSSFNYDSIIPVDVRFLYENNGGSIRNSRSVTTMQQLIDLYNENLGRKVLIIFHCEYSSERGPHVMKVFRQYDRTKNLYPKLSFPDVAILDGGYSKFYRDYPHLCDGGYIQMYDDNFTKQLKECNTKFWEEFKDDSRPRPTISRCVSADFAFFQFSRRLSSQPTPNISPLSQSRPSTPRSIESLY